jgi:predicted DNA-binding protein (UPF0251 family)
VEDVETLRPALAALPERERRVVGLRFYGGLTQSQIADEVGCSQVQISRILRAALTRLRAMLGSGRSAAGAPGTSARERVTRPTGGPPASRSDTGEGGIGPAVGSEPRCTRRRLPPRRRPPGRSRPDLSRRVREGNRRPAAGSGRLPRLGRGSAVSPRRSARDRTVLMPVAWPTSRPTASRAAYAPSGGRDPPSSVDRMWPVACPREAGRDGGQRQGRRSCRARVRTGLRIRTG